MAKVIDPVVHELLRQIRDLTSQQFIYEDPWHGFVPLDGSPTECQIGPAFPFAELGRRDRADVILSLIAWKHYDDQGLDWRDQQAIADNVIEGRPPHRWLEGTSFHDTVLRAERRDGLIQETFELSRKIGFAHFLAENFNRPDPVLVRLGPEEREVFLRDWWDAARERLFESYREQVAGMTDEDLARSNEAYQNVIAAANRADSPKQTPDRPAGGKPGQDADTASRLRDELFGESAPHPQAGMDSRSGQGLAADPPEASFQEILKQQAEPAGRKQAREHDRGLKR
jgi:hypothetical protein